MQWISLVVGSAIVVLVFVDVFWTVMWSSMGAGPLSAQVTGAVRRAMGSLTSRRRVLSAAGPFALAVMVLAWAALLLVGFTLVLQAMPDGIQEAATGRSAGAFERAYDVGFTIFTLGMGDFVPHGDGARAVTVLMNASGMLLVTLSVTYLLPVIGSSVQSRSMATSVRALGDTPARVIVNAWDGQRIQLDLQLHALAAQLNDLAQKHLAYPVLRLFYGPEEDSSAPAAVLLVEDTLNLLELVRADVAPPVPTQRQARAAVGDDLAHFEPDGNAADHQAPSPGG